MQDARYTKHTDIHSLSKKSERPETSTAKRGLDVTNRIEVEQRQLLEAYNLASASYEQAEDKAFRFHPTTQRAWKAADNARGGLLQVQAEREQAMVASDRAPSNIVRMQKLITTSQNCVEYQRTYVGHQQTYVGHYQTYLNHYETAVECLQEKVKCYQRWYTAMQQGDRHRSDELQQYENEMQKQQGFLEAKKQDLEQTKQGLAAEEQGLAEHEQGLEENEQHLDEMVPHLHANQFEHVIQLIRKFPLIRLK